MIIRRTRVYFLLISLLLLPGCKDNSNNSSEMSIENKELYVTSYENINLTEALDKISFDVKLPTYIPFEAEGIYSDVDIIKEKGEQIVVHYSRNNDTKGHYLHIIADNVIPAKYNTDPYYSEGDYYQSLVWIEDRVNYRLVYFIGDISGGQQPLSEEEIMRIVESMK